ncbi:response regulator, partial [Yersinia pestis]
MINVALIDDHIVVRSGFAQLLSLEEDIRIIGEYGCAAEAWENLPKTDVHVAVIDISMPDESGLSLLKRLRQQIPHFRAIILSIYDTTAFVQSAMDAGASGYLTKRCDPAALVQALRTVNGGGLYLCTDALRALRQMPQQPSKLTIL